MSASRALGTAIAAPRAKSCALSVRDWSTWLQKSALMATASQRIAAVVGLASR